jgi:YidC/Oxa1 family membrane protein insertase
MTEMWAAFLELFQVGLFSLTQFYGGHLASAIVSFSLLARLALLPLTVRMTLRARSHARTLRALKPALESVKIRCQDTPERLAEETLAVYKENGVSPMDAGVMKTALFQTPIFLGLYHAVQGALNSKLGEQAFLWVSNIARPDLGVAVLAASVAGIGGIAGASEVQPTWTLAIPVISSGIMALMFSAGFGLYLVSSGLVTTLQGLIVRRIEDKAFRSAF